MPTVVGILTFISRINATSERLKQDTSPPVGGSVLGAVEISCLVELSMKKGFLISGPCRLGCCPFKGGDSFFIVCRCSHLIWGFVLVFVLWLILGALSF